MDVVLRIHYDPKRTDSVKIIRQIRQIQGVDAVSREIPKK
jgi:hypothetical protein